MMPAVIAGSVFTLLLFALGWHQGDTVVMVSALSIAGLAFITNLVQELDSSFWPILAWGVVLGGVGGYVKVIFSLLA
ncbi:MAG: hypothetical protein ACWGQW_00155 [bacterium]